MKEKPEPDVKDDNKPDAKKKLKPQVKAKSTRKVKTKINLRRLLIPNLKAEDLDEAGEKGEDNLRLTQEA